MGILFFHQRKPRQFSYKPRHFDPEKEAREQRRKELCGADAEQVDNAPYVPGQYIKNDMYARRGIGRAGRTATSPNKIRLAAVAVGLLLLAWWLMS